MESCSWKCCVQGPSVSPPIETGRSAADDTCGAFSSKEGSNMRTALSFQCCHWLCLQFILVLGFFYSKLALFGLMWLSVNELISCFCQSSSDVHTRGRIHWSNAGFILVVQVGCGFPAVCASASVFLSCMLDFLKLLSVILHRRRVREKPSTLPPLLSTSRDQRAHRPWSERVGTQQKMYLVSNCKAEGPGNPSYWPNLYYCFPASRLFSWASWKIFHKLLFWLHLHCYKWSLWGKPGTKSFFCMEVHCGWLNFLLCN